MKTILNKIINRLNRLLISPIEIFIKSRKYSADQNYIVNSNNINKCFDDRLDIVENDIQLLTRISTAYKKAINDLYSYSEIFRPSNEWLPIYQYYLKEIIQALEKCDVSNIDKIYRNFWRESCSVGLVGLPVNMQKS